MNKIGDNHVQFMLLRKYEDRLIEVINQNRKISKFVNSIEYTINNHIVPSKEMICCEIFCELCESKIIKEITDDNIYHMDGFINVHKTQYGRCCSYLDHETANKYIEYLNSIKFCDKCVIIKHP